MKEAAAPRPLPPALESRLERILLDAAAARSLDAVDDPRSLPPKLERRLARKLTAQRRRVMWLSAATTFTTAAAIVALAVGGNALLARPEPSARALIESITKHAVDRVAQGTPQRSPTVRPAQTVPSVSGGSRAGTATTPTGSFAQLQRWFPIKGPTGTCGSGASNDDREIGRTTLVPSGPGTMRLTVELRGADLGASYEIWLVELVAEGDGTTCGHVDDLTSVQADDQSEGSVTTTSAGWTAGEHRFQVLLIPTDVGGHDTDAAYVTDPQTFTIQ
jgi:hypothetical protein